MNGINPVTLKELRQLVRTRIILWAMFIYPIVLCLISGCVLSVVLHEVEKSSGPATAAYARLTVTAGRALMGGTLVPLGLLTTFVIPLVTGVRLARETAPGRIDLQFTTALTAQEIVGGKLMGAFLMTLTFTALSLPFLTLAYLMRGIDLAEIAWSALGTMAMGLVSTAFAVVVGSFRLPVGARLSMLALGYVVIGIYAFIAAMVFLLGQLETSFDAIWVKLSALAAVTLLVAFARTWAASNVMPLHTDYKHGLRRFEVGLVVGGCVLAFLASVFWGDSDVLYGFTFLYGLLTVVAVFAVFLPPGVPRVVAARAPRSLPGRFCAFPFVTTAASGGLFVLLLSACVIGAESLTRPFLKEACIVAAIVRQNAIFGEVLLVAVSVRLLFHVCKVRPQKFAMGPKCVLVVFVILQMAGIFENLNVLSDAAWVFGYFNGFDEEPGVHLFYGLGGLLVYLLTWGVGFVRVFPRYKRPDATT